MTLLLATFTRQLSALIVGPIQFDEPRWLLLIPVVGLLMVWFARSSLSAMGTTGRRVALVIRLLVVVLLAAAMAEPALRREAKDVAVTVVTDASKSVPQPLQAEADTWVERAVERHMKDADRLGAVTVAMDSYVQTLPSQRNIRVDRNFIGATEGTDLAAGIRLALAVRPSDAAYRIVLMSDGNETVGSLLQAAEAAKAAGVPIDVVPLAYRTQREVIIEELIAPTTARMGENIDLKLRVTSTAPASGRIVLLMNGQPVDLDPGSPGMGWPVQLAPGTDVLRIPFLMNRSGPTQFEAIFEPDVDEQGRPYDTILENNRQLAVTFVGSEGRVLLVASDPASAESVDEALRRSRIGTSIALPAEVPATLTELNAYEAIFLIDTPAFDFSQAQMEAIRQYVHDGGGGLVKIGGPNSFGAGGWIGTPVEDALPMKLDPPQKKNMPRGALALVMHSIEMPQGIHYGKETAKAAVDALTRLDLIGINEFSGWGGDVSWVHPISEVGDKSAVYRSINNLKFGDMQTFDPSLRLTLEGLKATEAGQKHVIVISDGDPSLDRRILQQFRRERITISTVGVFPHSPGDLNTLRAMAQDTGGKFYAVTTTAQLATLPQIFFKEAQLVRRPLIWEGDPFVPGISGALAEAMRGIRAIPPIRGYVVTAERPGLATITMRGKEEDVIAAQWQYGLGRVYAITTDTASRWAPAWGGWVQYQAFWEQHARWAMRARGDANMRLVTERQGDTTRVIVEATDPSGEHLNFATMQARVARPDGTSDVLELSQVGPGRYEGRFRSNLPGSYVIGMKYSAPQPGQDPMEGSVQAAVNMPFADEFRALEDNAALLRQVAAMTGGDVLELSQRGVELAELWRRDGVTMPVAMRPIWLVVAIMGMALFLVDVAVRRVRIDVRAIALATARAFGRAKPAATRELDTLREAREKARQKLAARAVADGEAVAATAKRKFEASAEQLSRKSAGPNVISAAPDEAKEQAMRTAVVDRPQQPQEGMSRLLKAKKRAQEGFDQEENT